jgi:protein MPE1
VREYIDRTLEESRRNENRPAVEQNTNLAVCPPSFRPMPILTFKQEQQDDLVTDQAEMDGMMLDPVAIQRTIQEMQAQLTQLQRMMNDPNVPQQGRKNAQMQANDLTMRIQQAQFFLNMATAEANGGVGPGGGGQGGFKQGEYRPGWSNPFPNQQPANNESPYQRLPVNPNRRRTQKRPADWDVDTREPKVARYWE